MNAITPKPKTLITRPGAASVSGGFAIRCEAAYAAALLPFAEAYFPHRRGRRKNAALVFLADSGLAPEAYVLDVAPGAVTIHAAKREGAFWALQTLRQLLEPERGTIPAVHVEDAPDLVLRGFMMDVSRDKIPTMETVKAFVDAMAFVKLNHFELYVEGFSFAYPSCPEGWRDETPFTPADYRELDAYCAERAIDFVPNQNGFGHMSAWLARPEYKHLAECEDGYSAWGFPFPPSTLNPLDPDSFELVKRMYADMLPHCGSTYFNLCGDEPFELGQGKAKGACDARGKEAVYVGFIAKLCAEAKRHGKTPMMWGDVLVNHPEAVAKLPSDVVFIDWGYDRDYPFEAHAAAIAKTGVRLVAAPGTSSWNSFASRRADMVATTSNAAAAMKRHGGLGLIQTDWGDFGHLQYLPFSWPGMLEAASASWSVAPSEADVVDHLDRHLVPEGMGFLGRCIVDLATYPALEREYVYNATTAFKSFMYVDPSPARDLPTKTAILKGALAGSAYGIDSATKVRALVDAVRERAAHAPTSLVKAEILQTCAFIEAAVLVNLALTEPALAKASGEAAHRLLSRIVIEHGRLWTARNRAGGLMRSLARPATLKNMMETPLGE